MFFQNLICIPSILKWRGFLSEDGDRIAGWQSWLCFCLLNHFGSSVKAMWKASTHLTEEPISPCSFLPPLWKDGASEKWSGLHGNVGTRLRISIAQEPEKPIINSSPSDITGFFRSWENSAYRIKVLDFHSSAALISFQKVSRKPA